MACPHVTEVNESVTPSSEGCAECLAAGQQWVELRECMICGHVGCCDSSIGKHATKHFEQTHHPVMKAYPHYEWGWCYVDQAYF